MEVGRFPALPPDRSVDLSEGCGCFPLSCPKVLASGGPALNLQFIKLCILVREGLEALLWGLLFQNSLINNLSNYLKQDVSHAAGVKRLPSSREVRGEECLGELLSDEFPNLVRLHPLP